MELPQGSLFCRDGIGVPDGRIEQMATLVRQMHELKGKSVVDIGANCGHMAFAYRDAGCEPITCVEARQCFVDAHHRICDAWNLPRETFAWMVGDVRDLLPTLPQAHILSLLGFIYHINDPFHWLQGIIEHVKPEIILLESLVEPVPRERVESPVGDNSRSIRHEMVHVPSITEVEAFFDEWSIPYGSVMEPFTQHRAHRQMGIDLPASRAFWVCTRT